MIIITITIIFIILIIVLNFLDQVLIIFNLLKSNVWIFFNLNNIFFKFINDNDNNNNNNNNNNNILFYLSNQFYFFSY
jgi:hypothetical protein